MTPNNKRITISDELLSLACEAYAYEAAKWHLRPDDIGGWVIYRAYVFGDNPASAVIINAGKVEDAAKSAFARRVGREAMEAALLAVAYRRRDARGDMPIVSEARA